MQDNPDTKKSSKMAHLTNASAVFCSIPARCATWPARPQTKISVKETIAAATSYFGSVCMGIQRTDIVTVLLTCPATLTPTSTEAPETPRGTVARIS